jgi:hypothetical protein
MLALAFREWMSHWPVSPQANDRKIGASKEATGEETREPKQSEEHGRRGYISAVGKKTERPH